MSEEIAIGSTGLTIQCNVVFSNVSSMDEGHGYVAFTRITRGSKVWFSVIPKDDELVYDFKVNERVIEARNKKAVFQTVSGSGKWNPDADIHINENLRTIPPK